VYALFVFVDYAYTGEIILIMKNIRVYELWHGMAPFRELSTLRLAHTIIPYKIQILHLSWYDEGAKCRNLYCQLKGVNEHSTLHLNGRWLS
jgi:hypothetical protein